MLAPAALSTSAGSTVQRRPQRNAARLASTAVPLSSIARSIASPGNGMKPGLVGDADHEHVGRDRVAEEGGDDLRGIDVQVAARIGSLGELDSQWAEIESVRVDLADHATGRGNARRDHGDAVLGIETGEVGRRRRGQRIEGEEHADATRRGVADRHRRDDRTGLLRQPRLVGGPGIDPGDLRRPLPGPD